MDSNDLYFSNNGEWRKWLSMNHDKEQEAWLFIRKKRSSKAGISYDEALEEALCFGWIDGKMQSIDKDRFVLRFSPRKARSIWSKRNREKAEVLISQGKMTAAGMAKIEDAKKNGAWDVAYTSRTANEMPDDLEAALSRNRIAHVNFHNFANSYRNMYIGWLNSARMEETRRRRIAEIIKRAELNHKIMFGSLENTGDD
jgi:uncharacterized protein YdeI (YjbR/CyaY-like superfamily)